MLRFRFLTAFAVVSLLAATARAEPTGTRQKAKTAAKASGGTAAGAPGALAPSAPVATVDGATIPYSAIEPAVERQVRQAQAEFLKKVYDLRKAELDKVVTTKLIETEARKAGQSVDDFLSAFMELTPIPTDEQVKKVFEQRRADLPKDATFEPLKEKLRGYLRSQDGRRRFDEYVAGLSRDRVGILLVQPEPFRFEVEATGPSRGAKGDQATVTIVEFADFQCPYCSRVVPTMERLLKEYEGRVRLVYRQFPLPFHPFAQKAAEASLCAAEQGKFWELHDRMFADQKRLAPEELKAAAKELGLDAPRFDACLDGGVERDAVAAEAHAAQAVGVQGTPAFFVNGVFLNGALPYEEFKALIDRELERGVERGRQQAERSAVAPSSNPG